MTTEPTVVGYWYVAPTERTPKDAPVYPMPVENAQPWEGQDRFLRQLAEKTVSARVTTYRGWSTCRLCKCMNGSVEFTLGRYRWPEGFRHYVEAHNVRPPQEFIDWVLDAEPSADKTTTRQVFIGYSALEVESRIDTGSNPGLSVIE